MALNNLASILRDADDQPGAQAAAGEAVRTFRALLATTPERILPDLATSSLHLADLVASSQDVVTALDGFGIEDLLQSGQPIAAGYLLARRATWRVTRDDVQGGLGDLIAAAGLIDSAAPSVLVTQTRRDIREGLRPIAERLGNLSANLPPWAVLPVCEDTVDPVRRWAAAGSWNNREPLLVEAARLFADPERRAELAVLDVLNPGNLAIGALVGLLDEIADEGLESVLVRYREAAELVALVEGWLAEPTAADSREYLASHPELATDPRVRLILETTRHPAAAQHLGILALAVDRPVADVYDLLDTSVAIGDAMAAVAAGDGAAIRDLRAAVPALNGMPFVGPLLAGVEALLPGDADHAAGAVTVAAGQATDLQRGSATGRLRRLRRIRVDLSEPIDQLIALIAPVDPESP
jgi:hypothetical protein